jgi:hypothetical protein
MVSKMICLAFCLFIFFLKKKEEEKGNKADKLTLFICVYNNNYRINWCSFTQHARKGGG